MKKPVNDHVNLDAKFIRREREEEEEEGGRGEERQRETERHTESQGVVHEGVAPEDGAPARVGRKPGRGSTQLRL